MKGKTFTERLRLICAAQHENTRNALRFITHNDSLPLSVRYMAQFKLSALPKASVPNRLARRCIITGRARSIIKEFDISRIEFHRLARTDSLPGIVPSSW
ncbi:40S ribosomal protein mrp2 [Mitosporidium daphniae]|uniref:Ribosomal protein S14 n=1 Tax=Mitosporidium daphniae TaxID=1485682 RepID=A0A098VPT1_9MICR|nr:uncharacterized protein DI09_4p480 [Mitosporidium daphniae]KGG50965.1 hypothetical protein DI09_4p480 [Mitosporidium daphniae]|eukprot:XP_013237392.1 uncharacterized protein DI09_4p480 [Mitosporidium daphniae]